jgi:hypothetical protein
LYEAAQQARSNQAQAVADPALAHPNIRNFRTDEPLSACQCRQQRSQLDAVDALGAAREALAFDHTPNTSPSRRPRSAAGAADHPPWRGRARVEAINQPQGAGRGGSRRATRRAARPFHSGDRQRNRALHTTAVARLRDDPDSGGVAGAAGNGHGSQHERGDGPDRSHSDLAWRGSWRAPNGHAACPRRRVPVRDELEPLGELPATGYPTLPATCCSSHRPASRCHSSPPRVRSERVTRRSLLITW